MLGSPSSPVPSSDIKVARLRQIFVWPLALDLPPQPAQTRLPTADRIRIAMRRVAAAFDAATDDWEEVVDLLDHVDPPLADRFERDGEKLRARAVDEDPKKAASAKQAAEALHGGQTYAEFVYFYDFLQRILFSDGRGVPAEKRPIRLWKHKRVREVGFEIDLPHGPNKAARAHYRAFVDRLQVRLFDSGAAIVVLEIDFGAGATVIDVCEKDEVTTTHPPRPMCLADALTISDHLRRVYTPYFAGTSPKKVPSSFSWRLIGEDPQAPPTSSSHGPKGLQDDLVFVREGGEPRARDRRCPPVAEHWREILEPLAFVGYGSGREPSWRHVLDERIPVMSWVSLTDAAFREGIGPGQDPANKWNERSAEAQRLDLELVGRGDWIRLLYADEVGKDIMPYAPTFLADIEKTAFYDRFAPDRQTTSSVRYLFAGYHFAAVGAGAFFDDVAVHHFRRHYFQMVLLANLELASLLVTSSRISLAVAELDATNETDPGGPHHRAFMRELESINEWFLTFVHRFRFSGVSNQIQPTELFDRLRTSMRLESLFQEVKEEIEAAVAFNSSCEERRVAASGERLANVATIGASVGLALTFLGMNMLVDPIRESLYKPKDLNDTKPSDTNAETPVALAKPPASGIGAQDQQATGVTVASPPKTEVGIAPRWPAKTQAQIAWADAALVCIVVALSAGLMKLFLAGIRERRSENGSAVDRMLWRIAVAGLFGTLICGTVFAHLNGLLG